MIPPIELIPQSPDFTARFPVIDQAIELAMELPKGEFRTELLCRAAQKWLLLATPVMIDPQECIRQGIGIV